MKQRGVIKQRSGKPLIIAHCQPPFQLTLLHRCQFTTSFVRNRGIKGHKDARVNAKLRHYLARKSRCFSRDLDALCAAVEGFVFA